MSYLVGIDTGGTFTDCVVMDDGGQLFMGKAPSTPDDFSLGIVEAVRVTAESMGLSLGGLLRETSLFSHSSTMGINAVITRSGAKTGLVTTAGFEDTVLIMRIMGKFAGLGEEAIKRQVKREKPAPIVPKELIRGVVERVDYKGTVVTPLDRDGVVEAAHYLASQGVEAVAVALLWSQANPAHEQQIKLIVQELYPQTYVTISSELVPVLGEYERTATTVMNAYVGPLVARSQERLEKRLKDGGFQHSPLVAQAHGGCLPIAAAAKQPVGTMSSGPVAGIVASKYVADLLGYDNVITTDMGGTSFDVGLIYGGRIEPAVETVVAQYHLAIPTMAVESIGAGGGSIAWVEPGTGILKVGPRSAGSAPGPACYGAGGTEPTVTDADLVLGYLNPQYFLGGRKALSREHAWQAIKTHVADPLGMDVPEAAAAIYTIVSAHMSDLIRSVTVGRGYDPRQCALFAYGGAGPVHAWVYGQDARAIVVPSTASVHSAMGTLASDMVYSYQVGTPMRAPVDTDRFNGLFDELEARARKDLRGDGFSDDAISLSRFVDMRYMRQVHHVRTPCPRGRLTPRDLEGVYGAFEALYERLYGKGAAYKEAGMQVITFRLEARGRIPKPALRKHPLQSRDPSPGLKGSRRVLVAKQWTDVNVYSSVQLAAGNVIDGPAIIETPITTVLIGPDQQGSLDAYLNTTIGRKGAA
ncbi:MAG: hydantoinase/oxoprolinase family protein [Chloroflexi bacterium]|nr:hydantoinase/oxoprolinase family protein [Chloroflexota bacterium]